MDFVYSDGGRAKYFKANNVGDCVVRAIANATGKDYKEVYDDVNALAKSIKITHKGKVLKESARDGLYRKVYAKYLSSLGWEYHPTCGVGKGVQMHLCKEELPMGNIIVQVSKHLTNVRDGVIYDTYDCSQRHYLEEGEEFKPRAVYGYYKEKKK